MDLFYQQDRDYRIGTISARWHDRENLAHIALFVECFDCTMKLTDSEVGNNETNADWGRVRA
jgi:hypothetical protein